jgi:hypothetical protein
MKFNITTKLSITLGALLLFGAVSASADDRGRNYGRGNNGWGNNGRGYGRNHFVDRGFGGGGPRYVAPPRGFFGGYTPGRFYSGRGYFYGNRFWARPYFGVGVGIPFGYGYRTPRGCGYVDGFGQFFPAPCF